MRPIRPLRDADISFLADAETYAGGPTFDLVWEPRRPTDRAQLCNAVSEDPTIITAGITTALGLRLPTPYRSPTHSRFVWIPDELPAVGVTIVDEVSWRGRSTVTLYIYATHVERATTWPYFGDEAHRDHRVHAFYLAAIGLTRRIHRRVPLLRASVLDETRGFDGPEEDVIAVLRGTAEAAGWRHHLADPWMAFLPLQEGGEATP